ncbi:hypothetical protein FB446DRAFT_795258 [Lentinula raphanica]|nr:hypothetical protein FB446DRAFT_795258 [Lentinula raphanica]
MNSRIINQRAEARKAQARSVPNMPGRRLRGPSHGLLGDGSSQRQARPSSVSSTTSLRHSQVSKAKAKGASLHARTLAMQLPDVTVSQDHQDPSSIYRRSSPTTFDDHSYSNPLSPTEGSDSDGELGWEDVGSFEQVSQNAVQQMKVTYADYRTRRDRTDISNKYWAEQMDEIVDAYLDYCWRQESGATAGEVEGNTISLDVVDVFGISQRTIPCSADKFQSASLVRSGVIPTSPLVHTLGFTIRTIDLYHKLFVRCPRLGMQSFSKSICDIHRIPFKPHLSSQLSVAFDIYVAILNAVRERIRGQLGRQGRNWRMLNACPPCQYRLREDEDLDVRMIVTMDGNDSLRRVERKEDVLQEEEAGGEAISQVSRERIDRCVGGVDYFASREETQAWDESNWPAVRSEQPDNTSDYSWVESRCEDRWENMNDSKTSRSMNKFHEHGWFVVLCRHMMLLLACDMIKSGELYQYPLSLLAIYFGAEKAQRLQLGQEAPKGKMAVAYDIMCKFSKTVKRSPLSPLAQWAKFLPVIGTMHGYAHERACQLIFLMLYVVGVGLEDGEGCERYFSTSNALASVTRYQSSFHRRQSIAEFAYYHDIQTYANLSKFIYGNYKQSLRILQTKSLVRDRMREAGIASPNVFYEWLVEEGAYLKNLCKTPPRETLEMEYFIKLSALKDCQHRLAQVRLAWLPYQVGSWDNTNALETKHRNEQENERKLIADVQALEVKLGVCSRWAEGSNEWERAKKAVREFDYQRALDKLEALLVARMFEMARLNVAGTGYKMRKHISNAMKTRSKSIQTALKSYNEASAALTPPRRLIRWEEILDLTFLSEFDLLRDSREDVREKRWATPKNRQIMLEFFKLIRAEEELQRLHVEIRRLLTFMRDEEHRLSKEVAVLEAENPALALQIRFYREERSRFNSLHRQRLSAIKKLKGFEMHNLRYFWMGTHVSQQDVEMAGPAYEPDSPWCEEADGGEGEEDELIERWSTVVDAAVIDE